MIDSSLINQTAGIDDSDTITQVNSATVNQYADNTASIDADKKSKVKDNILTAASVQDATVDRSNTNSDDDINVIQQLPVRLNIALGGLLD